MTTTGKRSVFADVRDALGGLFGGKLEPQHETLVQGMFGLLGAMARADGVVSTDEANFTNSLMDEIKLSTRARALATDAFAAGCKRDFDIDREMLRITTAFPRGSSELDRIYRTLIRLAAADGTIRPGERRFLDKVTLGLGYAADELEKRLGQI